MARGWESKSVEAQIEQSNTEPSKPHPLSADEVSVARRKADLILSRRRVLEQLARSSSERYSELLRRSLSDLDAQLAALG